MEMSARAAAGGASGPVPVAGRPDDPMRAMTRDEFAALGGDEIVYRRTLSGAALKQLFPEAGEAPDAQAFHILFGADGAPRFVTDSEGQVHAWLSEAGLDLATRH